MFAMPLLIGTLGWRMTFFVLGGVGFLWAFAWYAWFRNDPTEHRSIHAEERDYILANRQKAGAAGPAVGLGTMLRSGNMWLTMTQYFCSNFTFFFALTWLYPYVKKTYELSPEQAGILAAILPFWAGRWGTISPARSSTPLYRANQFQLSRRLPAVVGFSLATVGLLVSLHMSTATGADPLSHHRGPRGRHDAQPVLELLCRYRGQERGGGIGGP